MLQELVSISKDIDDTDIIRPLFKVYENNLDFNLGNPGDLVRVIERFEASEYNQELYASVKRKPTEYNL